MQQAAMVEGRRERKKRELRERIYESARQLFIRNGFEATTIEQITEAADVAQATFFNHFQNKQAVLSEMTGEVFDAMRAMVDEQLSRPVSAQERLRGFAESGAVQIEESRDLARDVLLELMSTRSRPGEAIPYLTRVHEPFAEIVRQGQANGEVRADLDPEFIAEMVVGAFNAAVTNWMNDAGYPLARRLREVAAFMGQAIATDRATTKKEAG